MGMVIASVACTFVAYLAGAVRKHTKRQRARSRDRFCTCDDGEFYPV